MMHNGWINLYKPQDISSFRAIIETKKHLSLGKIKIGHAGTLDELAEGVLPVAMGNATRLIEYMMNAPKTYIFKAKFGVKTDTGDNSGLIISTTQNIPSRTQILDILPKFLGLIMQKPHKYSALKVNGKRAYKLARENITFDLQPRQIEIFNIKIIDFDRDNSIIQMEVDCSKGTYIRSLAEDIAESLHSLCVVVELIRTRVGSFYIEDAVNIENLTFGDIIPTHKILDDILVCDVEQSTAMKIKNGQKVTLRSVNPSLKAQDLWIRYDNQILSIGSIHNNIFTPKKCFNIS